MAMHLKSPPGFLAPQIVSGIGAFLSGSFSVVSMLNQQPALSVVHIISSSMLFATCCITHYQNSKTIREIAKEKSSRNLEMYTKEAESRIRIEEENAKCLRILKEQEIKFYEKERANRNGQINKLLDIATNTNISEEKLHILVNAICPPQNPIELASPSSHVGNSSPPPLDYNNDLFI